MTLRYRLGAFAAVAVVALAAAVVAPAFNAATEVGAPGQACEQLEVKGKKTVEQRARFKKCIQDAVAKLEIDGAATSGSEKGNAKSGRSATSRSTGAPGQVCKKLKVNGKKTDEQHAAFNECIQDAVAGRQG
jgi:hypothetical protein